MNKPSFVYVTYIQSTPEKVFNAITDPELTKQYWFGHHNASDWKVGSGWRHEMYEDPSTVHVVGKVLENDPPKRLVVSWASPADEGNPERTSKVIFEVEPYGPTVVKLTVIHDELEGNPKMAESVSFGWPVVLAGLKTLLETNVPLSMPVPTTAASK
jgi:uncharacterized protein YndB with AHSA1/START domain